MFCCSTLIDQALFLRYDSLAAAERASKTALEGGNTTASVWLAETLSQQPGREAEAEKIYRSLIEVGETWCYNLLGKLLEYQERVAEAEEAYRKAIQTADFDGRAIDYIDYYNLGDLLSRQGESKKPSRPSSSQLIRIHRLHPQHTSCLGSSSPGSQDEKLRPNRPISKRSLETSQRRITTLGFFFLNS